MTKERRSLFLAVGNNKITWKDGIEIVEITTLKRPAINKFPPGLSFVS
jgi:hypothetical protein